MQQQMTPEQMKQLQDKLSKMSHEELKEYQKQNCIFCHIVSGEVQSKNIYEGERSMGMLEINPDAPGQFV